VRVCYAHALGLSLLAAALALSACGSRPSESSSSLPAMVEGVRVVAAKRAFVRFCRIGSRKLQHPVLCPTLVPAHDISPSVTTELCVGSDGRIGGPGCFRGDIFLIQEVFQGPTGYLGLDQSSVGHLNVWASPRAQITIARLGCERFGRRAGTVQVRGHFGTWVLCPEDAGPLQDRGHVLLRWEEDGLINAVSLHGHSALNRRLALVIAQHLVEVRAKTHSR
jgi:hypothetical protein